MLKKMKNFFLTFAQFCNNNNNNNSSSDDINLNNDNIEGSSKNNSTFCVHVVFSMYTKCRIIFR